MFLKSHTVCYRLTPKKEGYRLELWEPAIPNSLSRKPYCFMVSYGVKSKGEAQQILNGYLVANGGQAADISNISISTADGKVYTTSYWPLAGTCGVAEETQLIYHSLERN
ncbi:hypothetical protein [Almyronema epifaneia]|uniref:Uncharacterized protein n=1 Tax=Almyronema epifaneia S1 TaxID=2991925 RepID=A0ABW6IFH7_9CYAN